MQLAGGGVLLGQLAEKDREIQRLRAADEESMRVLSAYMCS